MRNYIEEKIRKIQQQPDNVRFKAVIILTIIVSIIIVLLWAVLLLPAQLKLAA